ncbi:hypothetical protein LGV61_00380 [Desulfurispirillum indicum]|uniref:hypothetical protein n=1 Tax=Desulfurispirillum indicum TaxID=936456 RepID=UPI001CF9E008|nr:hypothetical protein [Desulfurispirillum indicum]UCZ56767.1 hypothetical protein LGV61_00380 [Desulfurispirillum indicum]
MFKVLFRRLFHRQSTPPADAERLQKTAQAMMLAPEPRLYCPPASARYEGLSKSIRQAIEEHQVNVGFFWAELSPGQRENCGVIAIADPAMGAGHPDALTAKLDALRRHTGISELDATRAWNYQDGYCIFSSVWVCDGKKSPEEAYRLWSRNDIATHVSGWLNWKRQSSH